MVIVRDSFICNLAEVYAIGTMTMESAPDSEVEFSSARIYLVGMMGVGKTTLGKQLAKQLRYSFLDTDKAIELSEGKSVAAIFEQHGELYFREIEQRVLKTTGTRNHIVIATGGGTPCYYNNIEWMNQHGTTIYLKAEASFIISRVSLFRDKRPLLKGKSDGELKKIIEDLLEARTPYYEAALKQIKLPLKSVQEAVKSVL